MEGLGASSALVRPFPGSGPSCCLWRKGRGWPSLCLRQPPVLLQGQPTTCPSTGAHLGITPTSTLEGWQCGSCDPWSSHSHSPHVCLPGPGVGRMVVGHQLWPAEGSTCLVSLTQMSGLGVVNPGICLCLSFLPLLFPLTAPCPLVTAS